MFEVILAGLLYIIGACVFARTIFRENLNRKSTWANPYYDEADDLQGLLNFFTTIFWPASCFVFLAIDLGGVAILGIIGYILKPIIAFLAWIVTYKNKQEVQS